MLFCMHRNRRLSIRMRIDNLLLVFKGLYDIIIICEIKRFRNENNRRFENKANKDIKNERYNTLKIK